MKRNSRIRAIQTRYKGYAFRSRLEARWAVYFDHLGIKWDYEPEGFELGNGLRYLPDFWLPDLKLWVEIKPVSIDSTAAEKATRLASENHAVLVLCGAPVAELRYCGLLFSWDFRESGAGFTPETQAGCFAHVGGKIAFLAAGSDNVTYLSREYKDELPTFCQRDQVDWGAAFSLLSLKGLV